MRCGFCVIVLDTTMGVWCDRKGVVTSPRTWRYSNDASGGDATNELTLEKKPKKCQRAGSLPACPHLLHLRKKTKRRWWAKRLFIIFHTWEKNQEMMTSLSTRRHLLHLRKKTKEMTRNQGNSPSFATLEKKNKEMTTN